MLSGALTFLVFNSRRDDSNHKFLPMRWYVEQAELPWTCA